LQGNLFLKLANDSKLTSNKQKKKLNNNLCLFYKAEDYKLGFCSKKQALVTSKSYSTQVAVTSKNFLKK